MGNPGYSFINGGIRGWVDRQKQFYAQRWVINLREGKKYRLLNTTYVACV